LFMFHLSITSNDKEVASTQEIWATHCLNGRI
jgi:hypothetical protein